VRSIYAKIIACYSTMLKMLKGLVMSPKKEQEVEDCEEKKKLSLRPQEGSLTAHWMIQNNIT